MPESPTNSDSTSRPLAKGPSKKRFEEVFSQGKRISGKFCRIASLPGAGSLGIATSKKIGAKPRRNRMKRRLREAVRLEREVLRADLDYVLIGMPSADEAAFDALRSELRSLIGSINRRWEDDSASS